MFCLHYYYYIIMSYDYIYMSVLPAVVSGDLADLLHYLVFVVCCLLPVVRSLSGGKVKKGVQKI